MKQEGRKRLGRTGCEEAHFPVGWRWTLCTHLAKSCCSGTPLCQTQTLFVPAQPSTMMCKQGSSVPNPATGAPGHVSAPTSRGLLAPGTTHGLCYSRCQLKCSENRLESLLSAAQRRPHICTLLLNSPKSKEFTGNHSLASGSFVAVPPCSEPLENTSPILPVRDPSPSTTLTGSSRVSRLVPTAKSMASTRTQCLISLRGLTLPPLCSPLALTEPPHQHNQ